MSNSDLLSTFQAATAEDLEELHKAAERHEREAHSLRAMAKALTVRLNGAPKRSAPSRNGSIGGTGTGIIADLRSKIAFYLMANGAKSKEHLATKFELTKDGKGCATALCNHDWFHVNGDGLVTISSAGEKAIKGKT